MRRPTTDGQARRDALRGVSVWIQLRDRLAQSRRAGVPFDLAYDRAVEQMVWSHDTTWRLTEKAITVEHRSIWEAAYNREPLPELDAFTRVRVPLSGLSD
jgi:hypothetical protein